MNGSLWSLLGVIGTVLISVWAALKYVVLGTYRLDGDASKRLLDRIKSDPRSTWITASEYAVEPKYPALFEALTVQSGVPFFFSRNERLMTAGWKGKEDICTVTFLRWHRRRMDALLSDRTSGGMIPISALSIGSSDKLGELASDPHAEVFLNEGSYEDMEAEVGRVVRGEVRKTGLLLHGKPGNGKTQFVKYLSRKYSLPVYVVYLRPDYDNYDIARMFSEVPRDCIVLLEDFDNYFNGRECAMKNDQVRFTFDSIINAFDGVHNDYRGVVFVMTANDLGRVDDSIKNRPSRFKFVREFCNPDTLLRSRILGSGSLIDQTNEMTLDQVFSKKDR